ncbi:hypothetical protein Kpol_1055p85 [Vanderwaltozyma polyspora DSM 70294]|uniref:C2H2-type domain-containing protein n=1 Tax=Vanderwaltozyma polyspora (strain ATCC 22028 / DSM 70294 / BCRC 21397 / CBS 2163 / NBRC 10782 / NRRL Y-8283 / UCD 57-17) TaxID=436907 RepID=A7TGF8_VANPO|nr:uncharacterized protein Kpol_1055p85 [Vanderwaltozyma polyspora DSM 70294]EDO18728.1 hypothetical protein Kpol_1055p85 [Vanderwaltozyma polyspora DSM 70294]
MSSNALFTCNSCVIQFKSSDLQRYHMKTEWHRYNLKRRVAQLPPITADEFAEKLQISEREQQLHKYDEFGFEILKPIDENNIKHKNRNKHKKSVQKFNDDADADVELGETDNRLTRKDTDEEVHGDNLVKTRSISPANSVNSKLSELSMESKDTNTDYGEDTVSEYGFTSDSNYGTTEDENYTSTDEDVTDEEYDNDSIDCTECIYCGVKNKEIEKNVKHMFQKHGLYIPERSYLVDLPGLLSFLYETIIIDNLCFCCNFQGSGVESIRDHLISKRHCRLPYESRKERELFAEFYDFSSLDETPKQSTPTDKPKKSIHFNENVEVSESLPEDETTSSGNKHGINSNYTTVSVDESGMEITLPNGTRAGHRDGQRYYRQNLSTPDEGSESRRTVTAADRRLISGVTEKEYKKGLKKMQEMERRAISKQILREGKRVNFQKHYRDELLQ